jgi:hypothetical protein
MAIPRPPKKLTDEEDRWYKQGLAEGKIQGRTACRHEVIEWLQSKYMGSGRPERGTPEATAILKLTRELSEFLGHKG